MWAYSINKQILLTKTAQRFAARSVNLKVLGMSIGGIIITLKLWQKSDFYIYENVGNHDIKAASTQFILLQNPDTVSHNVTQISPLMSAISRVWRQCPTTVLYSTPDYSLSAKSIIHSIGGVLFSLTTYFVIYSVCVLFLFFHNLSKAAI